MGVQRASNQVSGAHHVVDFVGRGMSMVERQLRPPRLFRTATRVINRAN